MTHPYLKIRALAGGDVEMLCYGPIGSPHNDPFEPGITARDVASVLQGQNPGRIILRVNSPGGDAFEGLAIYNLLSSHSAKVEVHVDGVAASAASVIAMAGDVVHMADNALLMVHDPWTLAMGTADDMRSVADRLDMLADSLARTYAKRTGREPDEFRQLMAVETWFNAEQAVEMGLADKAEEPMPMAAGPMPAAWFERFRAVPQALLERITVPQDSAASDAATMGSQTPEDKQMSHVLLATLVSALALQDSSDEKTALGAITDLRAKASQLDELEQLIGKKGSEALGAVKGLQAAADAHAQLAADKAALELDGQKRDFAAALDQGRKDRKLTPATEKHFQAKFDGSADKAAAVAELRAFLQVAPEVLPKAATQPQDAPADDGKSFADMKPIERANLKQTNPELYAAKREAAVQAGLI
jgi:ATP-dependent protease ClpP protease subunit